MNKYNDTNKTKLQLLYLKAMLILSRTVSIQKLVKQQKMFTKGELMAIEDTKKLSGWIPYNPPAQLSRWIPIQPTSSVITVDTLTTKQLF